MKTDDLIRVLARDTLAEPPLVRGLMAGLVPALAIALAGLLGVMGPRADLVQALANPLSVMRFVLGLALGALALIAALRLARPGQGRGVVLPVLVVPAVAGALWIWAWVATPDEGRQMAMVGKTLSACLTTIPALSVLPVAAGLLALRRGAPTRPALAGAMVGLGSGGLAAAIYALHCTEDSPLFYVTWYGLAIVGVTLASTLIGARALRW